MGQWVLEWGWAVGLLVFVVMLVLALYRSSVDSWSKAGGNWKTATLLEIGPFVTFAAKVGIGTLVIGWAVMHVYGAGQGSPVARSFYNLGSAGVSALSGTFQSYEITMPEAPSLKELVTGNLPSLPSETDMRRVIGVPEDLASPVVNSAPAVNNAPAFAVPAVNNAPVNNWSPPEVRNINQGWGKPAIIGPQPKVQVQGPAPQPTQAPAPTQGPAPQPAWNVSFGNGGGGALQADADNAVASVGTYTVKGGDSLNKISMTVYGNRHGWAAICNANRQQLPDCNNLRAGMVLQIP